MTRIADDIWNQFTIRSLAEVERRRTALDLGLTKTLREFDAIQEQRPLASATFELTGAPALIVRVRSDGPTDLRTDGRAVEARSSWRPGMTTGPRIDLEH